MKQLQWKKLRYLILFIALKISYNICFTARDYIFVILKYYAAVNFHVIFFSIVLTGISIVLKIANTSSLNQYGIDDTHPNIKTPYCEEYRYNTNAYWECFVRHFTFTIYHPSSTCTMGGEDDPKAVVDPQLR